MSRRLDNPATLEWRRVPTPAVMLADCPDATVFMHPTLPLVAIRSRDLGRWHLSVSHRYRVPTWGELGEARDALLPADLHFMVPHPPRRYWMNVDRRVLHLWEMRDRELAEQFEWEGEEAQRAGVGTPDSGEPGAGRPPMTAPDDST